MKREAIELTERGFAVLPLHPKSKTPITRHGVKDASTDPGKATTWFDKYPAANVGIACGRISNIVVLDVDGPEGEKTLAEYGTLPTTLEVKTSRGRHLYFRYPKTGRIPSSKLEKIDVQSDGKYVVAPPSIHPNGPVYRWTDANAEIAKLPEALLTKLVDSGISAGSRHDSIRAFACELIKHGANPAELREATHLFNKEKCSPPKPLSEVDAVVTWVLENHNPPIPISDFDLDWFAFDCRKFLGDATMMTLTDRQLGWWTRLSAFAWMAKGVLPSDMDKLFKLSGADDRELFNREIKAVLIHYQQNADGELVNAAMAKHWNEKQQLTKKRVLAARARQKAKAMPSLPTEQRIAA
jgi:hypothetical protein